jgi:hypothetical protein
MRGAPQPRQGERMTARRAAWLALLVGSAYAIVSAYWAAGGTGLLDTVGGSFERAGVYPGPLVVAGLWLVVAVKLAAALLPLAALTTPARSRGIRGVLWLQTCLLIGYGFALTAAGLLVQSGLVPPAPGADQRALAWHTYLWDPWFLMWGLLCLVAMRGRAVHPRAAVPAPTLVRLTGDDDEAGADRQLRDGCEHALAGVGVRDECAGARR